MGPLDLIPIALSGVAIWMFYLLVSQIRKKPANAYLAFLQLAMFLAVFVLISIKNELYTKEHYLVFLPIFWTSVVGSISFLYLRALIYNRTKLRWSDLLFFIPLMAQVGYHTYWFIQPFDVKFDYYVNSYLPRLLGYENLIAVFFILPLDVSAFVMTMKFVRRNWNLVTKKSKPILVWARNLSVLFLIRSTAFLINNLLAWVFKVGNIQTDMVYVPLSAISLIFLWLAYYMTKHPVITRGYIKYTEASKKNTLFEQKLESLVEKRIYDPDLGPHPIAELSKLMDVEMPFLGKYFKIHMNRNYPGYVRNLRMQKFRDLVVEARKNGADIQINLLQQQCGYRNRSSFNRDVSEVFGRSPSQFIEN